VLTQLNVWLDVVFTSLYAVIVVALSCHFLGNILTGRAKRGFGGWEWPHHEGGPIPAAPKIMHFQHVAAMIALAVSGMYIRFPFFNGGRWAMRWVHYIAMIIVIINLIARLWYAFASSRRDYKEFAITKRDITTAPKVILYYIFVKPSKPHLGKYNVMQKSTYIIFVPLLILQAITGFALLTYVIPFTQSITYFGHVGVTGRDVVVGWWLGTLLSSTDLAGWYARTAHYIINWLFIILTTIHVYLSVTEDFPAFLDFFGLDFAEKHEEEKHNVDLGLIEDGPAVAGAEHG
jgi:Ni,Fe-hydrogenase I cytochrome b subunit